MDKIRIQGGVALKGKVAISGAKNAALPIMAAALLADGPCTLTNLPALRDIQTHRKLLAFLGASFTEASPAELMIDPSRLRGFEAPYDLVKTMRASILVLGPLVARLGKARVSLPGGCAIGARPINLHLKALEQMGAKTGAQTRLCGGPGPPAEGGGDCLRPPDRDRNGKYPDGRCPG